MTHGPALERSQRQMCRALLAGAAIAAAPAQASAAPYLPMWKGKEKADRDIP